MWLSFSILKQPGKRLLVCGLLLGITTATAAAQDLETTGYTLSLREAIVRTIEHNPDLRTFEHRLQAEQGRIQQAGLAPSPELNLVIEDAFGTGQAQGLDSAQATLSISWVLERGLRQHYIDAAHARSSLVAVEADIKQLDVAAETARRYLISLAYQERGINADKTIELAEETVKSVHKRVQAGKTPRAELSRAQAELARRKLEREDIEHELLAANHRLAAQWGERQLSFARVGGDITKLPQIASFETLKAQLPQNPEFARLLSDKLLQAAKLQLALAQDRPSWRVNAGVRHFNSTNDQALVAGISIPFGKRTRNPGRIAAAQAGLAQTSSAEQAISIRIETALLVMYENLQHSLHVIKTVSSDIIPPLEQALIETRRAYKLGRYSYLELRSVQAELLEAQNALIEASVAAHRNIIEIERLTGVRLAQAETSS